MKKSLRRTRASKEEQEKLVKKKRGKTSLASCRKSEKKKKESLSGRKKMKRRRRQVGSLLAFSYVAYSSCNLPCAYTHSCLPSWHAYGIPHAHALALLVSVRLRVIVIRSSYVWFRSSLGSVLRIPFFFPAVGIVHGIGGVGTVMLVEVDALWDAAVAPAPTAVLRCLPAFALRERGRWWA